MVLYILYIKAEIEGVKSITLDKGANICVDIRNPISDEIREKIVIDPTELIENDDTKEPPYHFGIRWEGSKKTSVLTVLDMDSVKTALKKGTKKGKKAKSGEDDPRMPRAYTSEDNQSFVPVLALESRGIEPFAFHPLGGEFIVESDSGVKFQGDDVDLSEGDWADYDETHDQAVSISEFESKFDTLST